MKIGFLVNSLEAEKAGFTTTRLACEAINKGHEAYIFGVGDLAYDSDEYIRARARTVSKTSYASHETFFKEIQGTKAVSKRITVDDLDVLMLRNVPSDDFLTRPWASTIATEFGRIAMRHGVIVLNDPNGLAKASSKIYLQLFPEEVRPHTLITRDNKEIKAFAKEMGTIVLKPLQGSGGASVFLVRPDDLPNLNQMIDAVSRDGYVIAQDYLPAAADGDTRLFMMNGRPLQVKGKYAAFRRVRHGDDMRSNIHAGGKLAPAEVTDGGSSNRRDRPSKTGPGRYVPGRPRRGWRQADGDQCLQPRRVGEHPEDDQDQLLPGRHRRPAAQGRLHGVLRPQLRQRGDEHPLGSDSHPLSAAAI